MQSSALTLPRLSIIIVSYNSRDPLERCLRSLTATPSRVDREIVVVDNASTDGTAEHARDRWPGVRLIEAGGNVGFARANNIGIRQTFGELVMLLNPDTAVPGGVLDRLVAALDARPQAAVVGPRIVDHMGRPELSFGKMISPLAELRQKVLLVGNDRRLPIISSIVDRMTRRSRLVDWVSGACLLIRRSDLEAAGLLDERFFLYTEDVDLCASVRARGREVWFIADAEIVHQRGRSIATARRASEQAYRRSQIAFYEKHHPAWAPFLKAYLKLKR
jgi:GT2 family glycosyltransferase